MRGYIFTPHEKEMLEQFLKTNVKGKGFRVLLTRIRKNAKGLREEMQLMESLLAKVS